jgi:DNA-binding NarL/FixJ family response regulator
MNRISVMLVDDNPTFLGILRRFIEKCSDLQVVGTSQDGAAALVMAQHHRPQVVLLDLAMPGMNGFTTITELRKLMPRVGIIVLTLHSQASYRQATLQLGADEFVSKGDLDTALLPAIERFAERAGLHDAEPPDTA